jgi:hypothetical protein
MSVQISLEANDRSTVLGLSTTNNYNTCTCISVKMLLLQPCTLMEEEEEDIASIVQSSTFQ